MNASNCLKPPVVVAAILAGIMLLSAIYLTWAVLDRTEAGSIAPVKALAPPWEYRVVNQFMLQSELNTLGSEGWELVSVVVLPPDQRPVSTFKRPLPNKSPLELRQ